MPRRYVRLPLPLQLLPQLSGFSWTLAVTSIAPSACFPSSVYGVVHISSRKLLRTWLQSTKTKPTPTKHLAAPPVYGGTWSIVRIDCSWHQHSTSSPGWLRLAQSSIRRKTPQHLKSRGLANLPVTPTTSNPPIPARQPNAITKLRYPPAQGLLLFDTQTQTDLRGRLLLTCGCYRTKRLGFLDARGPAQPRAISTWCTTELCSGIEQASLSTSHSLLSKRASGTGGV